MQRVSARTALRQLRTLYTLGTLGAMTDAQLLDLFLSKGGDDAEDAFAALVDRHGPMVLGVCRRMLLSSHDAEDAFQAAFLILARRAASIGRREKLAGWLHGVAVRTASETRRRAARERTRERRLMAVAKAETAPAEDWDDVFPLLDEELNRLPQRFQAALVACELEGKSRREAALQLGLSEGTLSTHLARGRKMLRERLLRRGVSLGIAPAASLRPPGALAIIPETLLDTTVQAALGFASRSSVDGSVAALAERVLKTMLVTRLSLCFVPIMAAGMAAALGLAVIALAAGSSTPEPNKPGADDLCGRVVDKAGAAVVNAQVSAVVGPWSDRVTIATARSDALGRFVLPGTWENEAAKTAVAGGLFGLFARAPDGRTGWLAKVDRRWAGETNSLEIPVGPVGDVRGRVTDQNGRPIRDAKVTALMFGQPDRPGLDSSFVLSHDAIDSYRATTADDGSFVLKNTPQRALVHAAIEAPGIGWLHFRWNSTLPVTLTFDRRLSQIKGRIKLSGARDLPRQVSILARIAGSAEVSAAGSFQTFFHRAAAPGADGSFHMDYMPPGRYVVELDPDRNAAVHATSVENLDVGPGAVASVEIDAQLLPTITGRVVDAVTGTGLAKIPIHCYRLRGNEYIKDARETKTDADGRYSIAAAAGVVKVLPAGLTLAKLVPRYSETPDLELTADRAWPDLKLFRATEIDGIVVDEKGQPVVGADVYVLDGGPLRQEEMTRTGPGGSFHFRQLDPDATVSFWARTKLATTPAAVIVRPRDIAGELTLTIDPKFASQIRGIVTDGTGKRLAGATVRLWWGRPYLSQLGETDLRSVISLETYVTSENGWFVFRGLWPGFPYGTEILASGHQKAEVPQIIARAGQTHDVGKIALFNTSGRLAGRVVGSDGRPLSGALVFNRGDGPETAMTSTDSDGQFQLRPLFSGTKFAFVRKQGYRFTGVETVHDDDALPITMLKTTERPPAWKPAATTSFDEQRAFAKQILVRLWEKYASNADESSAFQCIQAMESIDLPLALQWSAARGRPHDVRVRQPTARAMAETDAQATLDFLANDRDRQLQAFLLAPHDLKQALALVEEVRAEDKDRCLAFIARAIARTDTVQAVALADEINGPEPVHERVKTAIAYKIGADRPDQAIKIIESIQRDNARRWQAEAFGWLAVALAPRDRTRAFALIDRALDMITEDSLTVAPSTGYEMLAAAHVADCARQIDYPDMQSVVMRVIAARPVNWRADSFTMLRYVTLATISLALLDPGAARTELNQIEVHCNSVGLNPAAFPNDRGRWLIASALTDLEKAKTLFEAELADLGAIDESDLRFQGIVNTAQFLATPLERRQMVRLAGLFGESWRPAQ